MTNKKHRFFLSFLLFFLGIMYICKIYVYTKILAKSILSNLCTKIISLIEAILGLHFCLRPFGGAWWQCCSFILSSSFNCGWVVKSDGFENNGFVRSGNFLFFFGLSVPFGELPRLINFQVMLLQLVIIFPWPAVQSSTTKKVKQTTSNIIKKIF